MLQVFAAICAGIVMYGRLHMQEHDVPVISHIAQVRPYTLLYGTSPNNVLYTVGKGKLSDACQFVNEQNP